MRFDAQVKNLQLFRRKIAIRPEPFTFRLREISLQIQQLYLTQIVGCVSAVWNPDALADSYVMPPSLWSDFAMLR